MADSVVEAVQQAAENLTENANVKVPASPEGMAIAYGSLVIMVSEKALRVLINRVMEELKAST